MTDREFDLLLYDGTGAFNAEDPAADPPKPWRRPLLQICWGLALNSITLNFLWLQYLLPALGSILLFLGFRTLRRENGWFRLGWILSGLHLFLKLAGLILYATPLFSLLSGEMGLPWGLSVYFLNWLTCLSLWQGLKGVFAKAGQQPDTSAAGGLVVCYSLLLALGLLSLSGLPAILFLILWLLMLRGLYRISGSLDEAGYAVSSAPVLLSDRTVSLLAGAAAIFGALLSLALFSRYPVSGTPTQPETGHSALRAELAELGFPKEILDDLTDEEVAQFEGALDVRSLTSRNEADSPLGALHSTATQVTVGQDTAYYVYYFHWTDSPSARYREGLEITPCWNQTFLSTAPQGRLLWSENGETYDAPLAAEGPSHTSYESFFGLNSYHAYYIDFSLPQKGDDLRFYVIWKLVSTRPGLVTNFNYSCDYTHQTSLFCYPYQSPSDYQKAGGSGAFFASQNRPSTGYIGYDGLGLGTIGG